MNTLGKEAIAAVLDDLGFVAVISKRRSVMNVSARKLIRNSGGYVNISDFRIVDHADGWPRNEDGSPNYIGHRYAISWLGDGDEPLVGDTYADLITSLEATLRRLLLQEDDDNGVVVEHHEPAARAMPSRYERLLEGGIV